MTSLAPVYRRLRKIIVDSIDSRVSEQRGEIQKSFSAQKSLCSRLDVGGSRREHPHRNFQALAYWIDYRHCTVAAFGSTNDSEAIAVERMIRIENLNMRGVRTQGIVRDDGSIHTCTAWCRPAVCPLISPGGSAAGSGSSSRSVYLALASGISS